MRRTISGFTLIELMITVAIVAILASVAFPAYTESVRRGRVAEATQLLSEAKVSMEQFYANNRTYAGALVRGVNVCSTAVKTEGQSFNVKGSDCTDAGFKLTATGEGSMAGFSYTINEAGTKTSSFTNIPGWSNSSTCWVMKKGQTC